MLLGITDRYVIKEVNGNTLIKHAESSSTALIKEDTIGLIQIERVMNLPSKDKSGTDNVLT